MPPSDRYDVLIVDDEAALSESTREYFSLFGVPTAWVSSGEACFEFLEGHVVRLILLDVNLGGATGFAVCQQLRRTTDVPILFISARGSDDDVLLALGAGGDDYIQKPYSLSVLLAKVQAVLKRYGSRAAPGPDRDVAFGGHTLRLGQERLFGPAGEVGLTALEYKLLAYLATHQGRVIPKLELFTNVWGHAITGDGTLNVHIRRLREKLGPDAAWIRTQWGTGYLFEAP
ncbi:MAG: response regulator transcription factor [Propionibacteriaceae bacterium]|jgi:two-component system response regulator RegX3|nr:response regulator transcription factor [Propionibacteriaceae bacterium]